MTALDRPVWHSLQGQHVTLSEGGATARRYRPEINIFGAAKDSSPDSLRALAALMEPGTELGLVEAEPWPMLPGTTLVSEAVIDQMTTVAAPIVGPETRHLVLGPDDGPDIFSLATLCRPGPFVRDTWRMGNFIGVREEGRLIAMAGQRWRVPGHVEISAVCTHPDARGRGLAGLLMRVQIARIAAGGDRAFLHVYPDNAGAIGLYESLGFRKRAEMRFRVVTR